MPKAASRPTPRDGGKYYGVGHSGSGSVVSYGDADPETLRDVVRLVTDAGDAITFSKTSDGGAMSIGLIEDGLVTKVYATDSVELTDALEGICKALEK